MSGQATVLLADDDEMIRALVEERLTADGYLVVTAESGDEALKKVTETIPTVVVLDWMMPGLGGPEVCKRLKENEATAHIPVLLLTSRDREDDIRMGFDCGADDYLTKPFDLGELQDALRRLAPLT